jgi:hypothetical protein
LKSVPLDTSLIILRLSFSAVKGNLDRCWSVAAAGVGQDG